ncbi:calcium-binding protein [Acidimicrobiia bacterium EGI L10123]|uniref:calcium-binding protein n=1 Tax=Salinilacustrithrix flava TaxID=2957203 RepID=UPI003D7C2E7E|nr:calcium-binding protein [Acidimicrobiia bacterium EGI L10123]
MADVDPRRRRIGTRAAAGGASLALFASVLTVAAPPAAAADPGAADITTTLNSLATWTEDLGSVGQLGEQLPGVPASPGAALGFDSLLDGFLAPLSTATVFDDLNYDDDIDLGDGRTGHLTSVLTDAAEGDKQLDITVTAETTLADQTLSIPLPIGADSNAPQSAFSSVGGVSLTVSTELSFRLVWEDESHKVAIVADGTTPRVDVDATATIDDLAGMEGAIGILGVSVVDPSNLDLAAHFTSSVSDPDNDGLLYFDAPTDVSAELAQEGSLAGLVQMGFDTDPGHLNGSFHLNAASGNDFSLSLPEVDATITVAWPDISDVSQLDVTATGIDSVGTFLNMTPRDLAGGIGQLTSALAGIQKSDVGDLELPFVKGKLSDAVRINEILLEFLDDHTVSAEDDPTAAGTPDFVSIQQFFDLLETVSFDDVSGAEIGVADVTYDDATSKLAFDIGLTRNAPSGVPLNGAGATFSGGGAAVTFGPGSLTDTSQSWETDQFAGHRVVAGTSGGTIASNTDTTLVLDPNGWTPVQPTDGSAYAISGMQGDIGTVQLGDGLEGGGIRGANGMNATAIVMPSYDATITLVLDLQDPTLHDPPLEVSNPDGTTYLASATPIGADRVLLRTGDTALFSADFPIDAGIDIYANAGFLQVELTGDVQIGPTSGSTDPMLQVNLKDEGDLTFGEVVDLLLNAPGDLLSVDVNVGASGSVAVSVPDAPDFLGSGSASATFTWNDLNQTSGTDGPQFEVSDLDEFLSFDFDPDNPRALFSVILQTLQVLSSSLADTDPGGPAAIFSEPIPVVGRSMRDLLRTDESGSGPDVTYGADTLTHAGKTFPASLAGRTIIVGTQVGLIESASGDTLIMASAWDTEPAGGATYVVRSELDDAISYLQSAPADNLQELVRTLDERLAGTPLSFEYDPGTGLILQLDWERTFQTSSPVNFSFDLGGTDYDVAGLASTGSVQIAAGGHVQVGIVVPLPSGPGASGPADATELQILDDSSIGVSLDTDMSDASFVSTLGPLKLALGDPTGGDKATAKASYSIDLAHGSPAGSPVSFADFVDNVDASLNDSSSPVDCGLPDAATDLALCAHFPLYLSTDGGSSYEKVIAEPGENAFAIRLPKDGADHADHFDLSGPQIDGHDRLETPDATELAAAIAANIIDFTQLDGIDDYFRLVETALRTASFGGKLPLIGEDLQQGADFVGEIRAAVDEALAALPADGDLGSTQGVRDWVNDELDAALDSAGVNPEIAAVDVRCQSVLLPPGGVTVTPQSDDGDTGNDIEYSYAVESYQLNADGEREYTQLSSPGTTTVGEDDLAAHPNDVTWDPADGAAGYRVFRDVGGSYELVGETTSTSFTDDRNTTLGDAPEHPAENPQRVDCDYVDLESVRIILDVHEGSFNGDGDLDCTDPADPCIELASVPLDIGLPGLSLEGKDGGGPAVDLGYRLHVEFGVNKDAGFFVDTNGVNDDDDAPEVALGLNFTLPETITARLGFISVTAENCLDGMAGCSDAPATPAPLFAGTFGIDLTSPDANGELTLADLADSSFDSLYDVKLSADLALNWRLKAAPGDDVGFPGIQAQFAMGWSWDDETVDAGAPTVEFKNVGIDAGAVFGEILGPVVNQIKEVTSPLDPVIKTLYAPIPVLSDLSRLVGGDDVTIVSIAKAYSTLSGGPDLTFIDTIAGVVQFINEMPECTADCFIPIGAFTMDGNQLLNTPATPDNTENRIATKTPEGGGGSFSSLTGALDSKADSSADIAALGDAAGFSFPLFEQPQTIFNVILGGDVDLIKFDSGPLTLAFDWRQSFGPVYAPPPVFVTMHGSASVSLRIVAGFDTYGIRKAIERVKNDETFDIAAVGDVFLQSLFFYTTENGTPIPVVTFSGQIAAGAEVSAVVIKVGIEGGVALTVSFLWNDPNADGKFRISEFAQAALNNPICLFTVSGQLSVFLKAYVTVGVSPFSVSFDFTIVNVVLLDFNAQPDCDPPPPELGGLTDDGTTLVVYAAGLDGPRGSDYLDQEKETIKVTSLHDYPETGDPTFTGVSVAMLGIRREYRNSNIERVIVDGRGYGGKMNVIFQGDGEEQGNDSGAELPATAQFALDSIVFGGSNDDTIKTGIGKSWVDGGAGNDIIVTGDRTVLNPAKDDYLRPDAAAYVAGGPGDDNITVGNGDDVIAGDSSLSYEPVSLTLKELINDGREGGDPTGGDGEGGATVSVPDWETFSGPGATEAGTDGTDTVRVGLGESTAYGNGGIDTLSVAPDNSLILSRPDDTALFASKGARLVGGTGSDSFSGGAHDDVIITGPDEGGLVDEPDADGGVDDGSTNTVDTGTGSDIVYGSTGQDFVVAGSLPDQNANIRGGAGEDVLVGGYGEDTVFGGPGNDYVIAEPSDVGPAGPDDGFGPSRAVSHRDLPDGVAPAYKVLVGGTGNDHIFGGDGGADIDGDGYNQTDRCGPGDPVASDPVDETINTPEDGNDKIIGGSGVDNIRAGGGNDLAEAKGDDDQVCGESGNDTLRGGADDDQAWGGSGNDILYGDAGDDDLFGNNDNDTVYGGADNDVIEGNDGTDWVSGGSGDDVILGGTRAAGRADQNDFLFGDVGDDTIIGDNGDIVDSRWYPLDLDGATPGAGGPDLIFGGSDPDVLYGGLDGDVIFGGDHDDQLEGNNGSDRVYGGDGADNIIGGSSEIASGAGLDAVGRPDVGDEIHGDAGDDVIAGDNAIITDNPDDGAGHPATRARGLTTERDVQLLDLGFSPTPGTSGDDIIRGNGETDVVFGQGGSDEIRGLTGDDYLEGGPGVDFLYGDSGADDIVGGSSTIQTGVVAEQTATGQPDEGDHIEGGGGSDVVIGDNGIIRRDLPPSDLTQGRGITERTVHLYDLGDAPVANTSGDDLILGDNGEDVLLGQDGHDRIKGIDGDDYVEGGPGRDWLEGNDGHDDIVGGSSTIHGDDTGDGADGQPDADDVIFGGDGDDVATGDNARITRVEPFDPRTERIGTDGELMDGRSLRFLDLSNDPDGYLTTPSTDRFGPDLISGGAGVDVLMGQDGNDRISGGADDDYAEGNGGADSIWGDLRLDQVPVSLPAVTWPGTPSVDEELHGGSVVDGQDDLMGGSSREGFRDAGDVIYGGGEADFILGDNGTIRRLIDDDEGTLSNRIYAKRYPTPAPADAAYIRVSAEGLPSTRFCSEANAPTCEPAGAHGADRLFGENGDDVMYGQDGNDEMYGGAGDDDMYGELGDDELYGELGDDAMVGDRGGIVSQYEDGNREVNLSYNQVPKIEYDGFLEGSVTRVVDLQHDVNGDVFVDNDGNEIDSQAVGPDKMPFDGVAFGGNDRMRGGAGKDAMHGGVGDDLMNGDSGGDTLFGGDGADVMWGGKGCDPAIDTIGQSPDCYVDGEFVPSARGDDDRMVDYLFGGKGAISGPSTDPDTGVLGSDILDWRPRGGYDDCVSEDWPVTTGTKKALVTNDPCIWFEMTDIDDDDVVTNQHHQGIDWIYGGWDRDILQGDVADNGPNPGDRLLDWNGAYNLYTHCNAAYGGFNDVRQHSPDMRSFLHAWAFTLGAGLVPDDVLDPSTSAFNELALVYNTDAKDHGSGKAFPSTPGHFDDPNACAP